MTMCGINFIFISVIFYFILDLECFHLYALAANSSQSLLIFVGDVIIFRIIFGPIVSSENWSTIVNMISIAKLDLAVRAMQTNKSFINKKFV